MFIHYVYWVRETNVSDFAKTTNSKSPNTLIWTFFYEEALKCYNNALKLDKNDLSAIYNKGIVLKEIGKYEEALKCFKKALELDPDYEDAKKAKDEILSFLEP